MHAHLLSVSISVQKSLSTWTEMLFHLARGRDCETNQRYIAAAALSALTVPDRCLHGAEETSEQILQNSRHNHESYCLDCDQYAALKAWTLLKILDCILQDLMHLPSARTPTVMSLRSHSPILSRMRHNSHKRAVLAVGTARLLPLRAMRWG